jgi:hypothetical protein
VAVGLAVLFGSAAASRAVERSAVSPADAFARLQAGWGGVAADADGPCAAHPFEIRIGDDILGCTHGPDPMPDDVRDAGRVDLADLRERAATLEPEGAVAGPDGEIPCVGTGTSGLRTVAIYAYPTGAESRYDEIAPLIRSWADEVDEVIDVSAGQTGGSRHVRWFHDESCTLEVREVALSTAAVFGGTRDAFTTMIGEMIGDGYDRYDRRYLVWMDASSFDTGICGIAMTAYDETPGATNLHNGGANADIGLFGRVDRDCWGRPAPADLVEAHELIHTMGAVQPHAPDTSSVDDGTYVYMYGHCVDEYDTMCYADGSPKDLRYECPEDEERLLDCGDDTYFNTNPSNGSYLDEHWNPAMAAFLVRTDPVAGFIDVGTSFRSAIAWMATSGITSGCTADLERFCPNDAVTRGQMASFLSRALDLPATPNDYFTDDDGTTHETAINRVTAAGIASGCTATRYCPANVVSRGQMASFLSRAFDLPATPNDYFTDDDGTTHETAINRVTAAGIASGCTASRYCPGNPVTRGQMAAFLFRALE